MERPFGFPVVTEDKEGDCTLKTIVSFVKKEGASTTYEGPVAITMEVYNGED